MLNAAIMSESKETNENTVTIENTTDKDKNFDSDSDSNIEEENNKLYEHIFEDGDAISRTALDIKYDAGYVFDYLSFGNDTFTTQIKNGHLVFKFIHSNQSYTLNKVKNIKLCRLA